MEKILLSQRPVTTPYYASVAREAPVMVDLLTLGPAGNPWRDLRRLLLSL